MLGIIFLLLLIVTVIVIFHPISLYGKTASKEFTEALLKLEKSGSETHIVNNPKILVAKGIGLDYSEQEIITGTTVIQKAFQKSHISCATLTANEFRVLLTNNKFDIVEITVNVQTDFEYGDVKVYFGCGEDFIPGDGFVELLEISETKLVILASCESLPLAAKVAARINMIASSDWLELTAYAQWQQVFYQLLGKGYPLSRAYSIAISTVKLSMAMIIKQDVLFTTKS